jgi:hypothetical protein
LVLAAGMLALLTFASASSAQAAERYFAMVFCFSALRAEKQNAEDGQVPCCRLS